METNVELLDEFDFMAANLRGYSQWINIAINLRNFDGIIKDANLEYGKFYKNGDRDEEIPVSDINGSQITEKKTFNIYSCGRKASPTGTEGSVDIYVRDGDKIGEKVGTFSWDCPYSPFSRNSFNFSSADELRFIGSINGGSSEGSIGRIDLIIAVL